MKEELIKFETAKLAKGRNFDEYTDHIFITEHDNPVKTNHADRNTSHEEEYCEDGFNVYEFIASAPRQSELQRWLREKHDLHIFCAKNSGRNNEYGCVIDNLNEVISPSGWETSYEIALEIGLQEALKLIK